MAKKWPELKKFMPKNPQKYVGNIHEITLRSSWEVKFCRYCDENPSVIQWNSEGVKVPYWSSKDQKNRTYHVDFLIKVKTVDGGFETLLIEIKPYKQTLKPTKRKNQRMESFINESETYQVNMDKWLHANEYAKERNWKFIVLTENELYATNKK